MSVTVAHTHRRKQDTILKREANVAVLISYLRHKVSVAVIIIIIIIIIIISSSSSSSSSSYTA